MSKRLIVGIAATGAVLLTAGAGAAGTGAATKAERDDKGCQATATSFENNGKVYLYGGSYCDGAHDEWDDDNDSDYGDGKGRIKDFDNEVDSIINKHKSKSVKFYNYPKYNEDDGDSFCVRPGHYVRRLYVYGDGGGTNDWWSNSISSHEFVDEGECDRWFGWLIE